MKYFNILSLIPPNVILLLGLHYHSKGVVNLGLACLFLSLGFMGIRRAMLLDEKRKEKDLQELNLMHKTKKSWKQEVLTLGFIIGSFNLSLFFGIGAFTFGISYGMTYLMVATGSAIWAMKRASM